LKLAELAGNPIINPSMSRPNTGGVGRVGVVTFGNSVHRPADDSAKKRKQVGEHHDGSFGVYMSHKIQKLRAQNAPLVRGNGDDETAVDAAQLKMHTSRDGETSRVTEEEERKSDEAADLFAGVHVYVDGYTVPSKEEIRSLVLLHGGGFEHYETSRVTHVVATHLATSKLLQYK
jgi:hypothetical protein